MRHFIFYFVGSLLFLQFVGCGQTDKSKILAQYAYQDSLVVSDAIPTVSGPGDWLKKGIVCYGIAMVSNSQLKPIKVKEVRAKVVDLVPNGVKMASLETLFVSKEKPCSQYLIIEGEEWTEREGELFKTKEEAIKYMDSEYPGLRME